MVRSPLRIPIFTTLLVASLVSVVGTSLQEVSGSWLMTRLNPSPIMVSLVSAASSLPMFLLLIPAGALADLVDRRRYLIFTQLWMMSVAGLMGLLTLTDQMTDGILVGLTFALGLGAALNSPGWQAVTPELVPRPLLPAAVSYNGMAINTARTLGPAIGGWVVASWGPGRAFLLNALSFVGVVLTLLTWRRRRTRTHARGERFLNALRTGLSFVRHSPEMSAVVWRTLMFSLPASAPYALLPLLVQRGYNGGAEEFGLLVTLFGIGAVLGSTLVGRLKGRVAPNLQVTMASLGYMVALILLAAKTGMPGGCLGQLLAGVCWMLAVNQFHLTTQLVAPDWVRSRALAVYSLALFGGGTLGSLVWGAVAEADGLRGAFYIAAGLAGLTVVGHFLYPITPSVQDYRKAPVWDDPEVVGEYSPQAGPVLVRVEYRINPENGVAFRKAMKPLHALRMRMGVLRWGLMVDMADPGRYLEVYLEDSWAAHLRHHERLTELEALAAAEAYIYHEGDEPPKVTHLLLADAAFTGQDQDLQ